MSRLVAVILTVLLAAFSVGSTLTDGSFPQGIWPRILVAFIPAASFFVAKISSRRAASKRDASLAGDRAGSGHLNEIGVFLSGFWLVVALLAPAVVGAWWMYPILLVMAGLVFFNRWWMERSTLVPKDLPSKEFIYGLMTTLFVGVPLIGFLVNATSSR